MNHTEKWIEWIKELQAVAQAGLYYGGTPFDKERYQAIRDIAASMMADITDLPVEKVKDLFCNEDGYQTPKLATRAAVFQDDKILLIKENSGRWALPGGWAEPGCTIRENAVKEVEEESGIKTTADYMIAFIDKDKHNPRMHPFSEEVAFVHCTPISGHFQENLETIDMRFFSLEEARELEFEEAKTVYEQLEMCFKAHDVKDGSPEKADVHWELIWD